MLTEREQKIWNELQEWEQQLFSQQTNEMNRTFEKWLEQSFSLLPENIQQQFFHVLDEWLFHLHAMIQSAQFQQDAEKRILSVARMYHPHIDEISHMQQLTIDQLIYIATEQIARHRLYSLVQGGLSGTGRALFLGVDIPAIAIINIRVIQLISMTYGYKVNNPFEMMASLKCFHGAMLPVDRRKEAWESLKENIVNSEEAYFYEGDEDILSLPWLNQPLKQLLKLIVIVLFKKKRLQQVPLLSMAIGAGTNYQLTKTVTDFSHKYYQYRYLIDQRGEQ